MGDEVEKAFVASLLDEFSGGFGLRVLREPRANLLFLKALDGGAKVFRNYVKARNRSRRNSRARR